MNSEYLVLSFRVYLPLWLGEPVDNLNIKLCLKYYTEVQTQSKVSSILHFKIIQMPPPLGSLDCPSVEHLYIGPCLKHYESIDTMY